MGKLKSILRQQEWTPEKVLRFFLFAAFAVIIGLICSSQSTDGSVDLQSITNKDTIIIIMNEHFGEPVKEKVF